MPLISPNRAQKLIDAAAKLCQDARDALVASQSLYSIITYTEDEDVETDIGPGAESVDQQLAASGALLANLFSDVVTGHRDHVTKAGVTGGGFASLGAYFTSQAFRMARQFADVLLAPATWEASNVFPAETSLGTFVHGGSYVVGTALELDAEGPARLVSEATYAIGETDWLIDVTTADSGPASALIVAIDDDDIIITVADASDFPASGTIQIDDEQIAITNTGRTATIICTNATRATGGTDAAAHDVGAMARLVETRTITMTGSSPLETQVDVLSAAIAGTSRSGQAVLAVTNPVTAGFAAGQQVLAVDDTYPRKLTADVDTAETTITVEDTWPFEINDVLNIHDDSSDSGDLTVDTIDRPAKTITFTGAVGADFTVAAKAHVRLKVAEGLGIGNNEVGVIESASDEDNEIVLVDNLRNTYYTGGYVYLLVAKVITATTSSGGQTNDAVALNALPDRVIAK